MTGEELKELMAKCDVRVCELAKMVRVTPNAVTKWRTGDRSISPAMAELIRVKLRNRWTR